MDGDACSSCCTDIRGGLSGLWLPEPFELDAAVLVDSCDELEQGDSHEAWKALGGADEARLPASAAK